MTATIVEADASFNAQGPTQAPLRFSLCAWWGGGSVGVSIMSTIMGALVLRYMTDFLGVAAGLAGLMIAASKVYDAMADPAVGAISDRIHTPIGRRRPFLLVGAILCPAAIAGLFCTPQFSQPGLAEAYMLAMLLLFATGFSVWQVPYLAMAAEMTTDYRERSRLFGFRLYGGAFGQLLAAACGPWLLAYLGGDRRAYGLMGWALAGLILASNLACFFGTRKARFHVRETHAEPGAWKGVALSRNRGLVVLLTAKSMTYLGAAASAGLFAYFVKYYLRVSDAWVGGYFFGLTVGIMASVPGWLRLGRRIEKKWVAVAAAGLWALTCASWLLARPGESDVAIGARIVLAGAGIGGYTLFGQSMFVDVIEHDYRQSGRRREGAFTGLINLVEKAFSAFGIALSAAGLSAVGYVASTEGRHATQSPAVVTAIYLMFPLLQLAGCLVSIGALMFYDLTEHRLAQTTRGAGPAPAAATGDQP